MAELQTEELKSFLKNYIEPLNDNAFGQGYRASSVFLNIDFIAKTANKYERAITIEPTIKKSKSQASPSFMSPGLFLYSGAIIQYH